MKNHFNFSILCSLLGVAAQAQNGCLLKLGETVTMSMCTAYCKTRSYRKKNENAVARLLHEQNF